MIYKVLEVFSDYPRGSAACTNHEYANPVKKNDVILLTRTPGRNSSNTTNMLPLGFLQV